MLGAVVRPSCCFLVFAWRCLSSRIGLPGEHPSQLGEPARGVEEPDLRHRVVVALGLLDRQMGVGERRQLRLADGTRIDLSSATALDLAYDESLRQAYLWRGEILVESAQSARPFLVHTAQGSVRALGTRFSVRCEGPRTRVCVLSHAVELRPLQTPTRPMRLPAGQQDLFDERRGYSSTPLREGEGSWTQGVLTVVDWPLGEFIAELSRYRAGVLRCAAEVAELRLSGAYRLDRIEQNHEAYQAEGQIAASRAVRGMLKG